MFDLIIEQKGLSRCRNCFRNVAQVKYKEVLHEFIKGFFCGSAFKYLCMRVSVHVHVHWLPLEDCRGGGRLPCPPLHR